MNEKKTSFWKKDGTRSVLASLLSILIGLAVGGVVALLVGLGNANIGAKGAWEGIRLIVMGLFSTGRNAAGALTFGFNPVNIGNMLFRATPLILTGLSVALAFKTGLFNIGAAGQYLAGTCATLFIALSIPSGTVPPFFIWLLAFLGGMLAGALWGAIPGLLKALLNINEVIACIMTNWIAANVVTWLFDLSNLKNVAENIKSGYIYKTTFNNVATSKLGLDRIFPGSQVNGGFLIAVLLAVVVYILLSKTTFGYELKACGSNRHAARYAGIRDKRNIVLSMALAGALAGTAGSLYYLSGNTEFFWNTYQSLPAAGFNGIAVALLAVNNPIAVIFTGCFMSMLNIAGLQLANLTAYNEYITDVIIAVIVYLSAFSLVIKLWLGGRKRKAPPRDGLPVKPEPPKEPEPAPADEDAGPVSPDSGKEAQE
ncbi:MAG: ABC transporter permease [Clostridia bacterium]|nr:ABC transporter permease [Clostridia bacterium]